MLFLQVNGYRSLHATVLVESGDFQLPLELQIRSEAMHLVNEGGPAAHSGYKAGLAKPQQIEQLVSFARTAAVGYQLPQPRMDYMLADTDSSQASAMNEQTKGSNTGVVTVEPNRIGEGQLPRTGMVYLDTAATVNKHTSTATDERSEAEQSVIETNSRTISSGTSVPVADTEESSTGVEDIESCPELSVHEYEVLEREVRQLQRESKFRQAVEVLQAQARDHPSDARVSFLLGEQFFKLGKAREARKMMARTVCQSTRLKTDLLPD